MRQRHSPQSRHRSLAPKWLLMDEAKRQRMHLDSHEFTTGRIGVSTPKARRLVVVDVAATTSFLGLQRAVAARALSRLVRHGTLSLPAPRVPALWLFAYIHLPCPLITSSPMRSMRTRVVASSDLLGSAPN